MEYVILNCIGSDPTTQSSRTAFRGFGSPECNGQFASESITVLLRIIRPLVIPSWPDLRSRSRGGDRLNGSRRCGGELCFDQFQSPIMGCNRSHRLRRIAAWRCWPSGLYALGDCGG